jgi:hypothetical protein
MTQSIPGQVATLAEELMKKDCEALKQLLLFLLYANQRSRGLADRGTRPIESGD